MLLLVGTLWLQPGNAQALLQVGEQAPGFTIKLFSGKTLTLDQLKGKPVVLNFWNSR